MCGFVGVFRGTPSGVGSEAEELRALRGRLHHRGPDAEGLHVGPGFGVAATRLAIQGDERGDPPLRSADGRFVLAFNGEVLATAQRGHRAFVGVPGGAVPPQEAGDGTLLVEALARVARDHFDAWATLLPELLEGSMGALAFLDTARDELWLARDRLGIKPLYVLRRGDDVHFASEIAPLLARFPELRRPNPEGLAELLHWQRPVHHLPFPDVEAVPPGTVVRVGRGGRMESVRVGPGNRDRAELAPLPPARATSDLATAWRAAARDAAAVDGPVALFLSGGVDSGAVALWAGRRDLLGVTGRFAPAGGRLDESTAAAGVAEAAGIRHEVVDLDDGDLLEDLPAVVRALEVPMAGPGALALWRTARRAREHARVVLTGTGGDELLGGYVRTALVLGRRGPWTRGYEPLAARLDAAGSGLAARQRAVLDRSADLLPYLDPDFAATLPTPEPPSRLARGGAVDPERAVAELVADEVEGTLPMLLHVEDRVTMAWGLEGRPVPCLGDVPAVAARVPDAWLVGPDGEGKRVLRAALAGTMPDAVRLDPVKRGFPTPFARAVRGAGREAASAIVEDRRFRERGWWNVAAVSGLLEEDRPLHDRALYALLSWELWARAFPDGEAFGSE